MNKLEMAHDWYLKHAGGAESHLELEVSLAWKYADAMQAEADKRDKAEAEQKRKEMRELLNAENTFIEREGQHFDDVEWQPDWSQAPTHDTVAWDIDERGQARWIASDNGYYLAPDFGYTGRWQDSLRKRPECGFKHHYGDGLECAR